MSRRRRGFLAITMDGIDEYEAAVSSPQEPTEHFPPQTVIGNYVHVEGSVSGQMQVGTTNSTQSTGVSVDELRALLDDVRALVDDPMLEPDESGELAADLTAVEAQLESPHPKNIILREGLSSARTVLEGVLARGAAAGAEQLPGLIERIVHAIMLLT
jgi:hypothetical protein